MSRTDSTALKEISADIVIVGAGTAGCMAAVEAKDRNPHLKVVVIEKANGERSGCLSAGMNAINAYLNPGETPESFTRYVRYDARGLIREDLVLSIAAELNSAVRRVEQWGLPILKNEKGEYAARGRWNIKIHGESLKPIIYNAALSAGAEVLNHVTATNFLISDGAVVGVMGFHNREGTFHLIRSKAVIVATGGASGLYKPNNDGSAHHKMWYSPFNVGTGFAMGLRAGAEMTSFEMRFIALRTKDAIAPTGTLALGFQASQVNAKGERFMKERYANLGGEGAPTCIRAYAPTREVKEGRGPCFLDTRHLTPERVRDLKAAYLDMYPGQVLLWLANRFDPAREPVEIEPTEPYIVGGHCQSGYWVTPTRQTTLPGLFAAGDVAGGSPYKFVSGAWAEGAIAARSAVESLATFNDRTLDSESVQRERIRVFAPIQRFKREKEGVLPEEMEERLQKVMDQYAGGISCFYEMNAERLEVAKRRLASLRLQIPYLVARNWHELNLAHEVVDRLELAEAVVEHLLFRKETRWPCFQTRLDYPEMDDKNWLVFVNSRRDLRTGTLEVFTRPYQQIVPGDRYSPK